MWCQHITSHFWLRWTTTIPYRAYGNSIGRHSYFLWHIRLCGKMEWQLLLTKTTLTALQTHLNTQVMQCCWPERHTTPLHGGAEVLWHSSWQGKAGRKDRHWATWSQRAHMQTGCNRNCKDVSVHSFSIAVENTAVTACSSSCQACISVYLLQVILRGMQRSMSGTHVVAEVLMHTVL